MLGFTFTYTPTLSSSSFLSNAAVSSRHVLPQQSKRVSRGSTITMRKSIAMPFMEAPPKLDGSMVGDVGFGMLPFDLLRFEYRSGLKKAEEN